ncbi:MAG: UvrD-helicase domain-containing protein [Bacteroidales bacterium]
MTSTIIIIITALIIPTVVYLVFTIRDKVKDKQIEIVQRIENLSTIGESSSRSNNNITLPRYNIISNYILANYYDKFILASDKQEIIDNYKPLYYEVLTLGLQLKKYAIDQSESLNIFINEYTSIDEIVLKHNNQVTKSRLNRHKLFFDTCLNYPLDNQQRKSIVSEAKNNLVVSSAGSGKTSSIVGKVKYLTEILNVDPNRILLISYTNKAATELTERIATKGLIGYTFHKLALEIIGEVSGIKPSICDNTDALFIKIYKSLLLNTSFKRSVIEYFVDYPQNETEWEAKKSDKRDTLSQLKKRQIKALIPDMDGNTFYVKSIQEQKICFALSSLGIDFRYEEAYENSLADETYSQYCPDFSIYYNHKGVKKRLYLEHFGVDEHGLVPGWFAQDKNISYEEANQKYNDGITWKKEAHKKFGTKLVTTSSADFHYFDIKEKLKSLLIKSGVTINEISEEELYDLILSKDMKREKALIRLIATFITLTKSNYKSFEEILQSIIKVNDKRALFIINDIIKPINDIYRETLSKNNQIDFTDSIIKATELCHKSNKHVYDHIIVDEFQDISVDRYKFLKALRRDNSPASLYCVGDDWQSIYRFSGCDMSLFNQFSKYFGETEVNKIETTYRFGQPLVDQSSKFIQRNRAQLQKNIKPFNSDIKSELEFIAYYRRDYCRTVEEIVSKIDTDKSIYLLGRYSFDDYYLSYMFKSFKRGHKFYYTIAGREIEFLTVHKSKGLEADYVILLQCNKDTYGFPSLVSDDPIMNYVLTQADQYQFAEERRLFYVAITRAKHKSIVLYDNRYPSIFVDEFLKPETIVEENYAKHRNANKRWTIKADQYLLDLHNQGKSIKYISYKMGRSQTSIIMRLGTLNRK